MPFLKQLHSQSLAQCRVQNLPLGEMGSLLMAGLLCHELQSAVCLQQEHSIAWNHLGIAGEFRLHCMPEAYILLLRVPVVSPTFANVQFAATACTIVSGAIAERARVEAYVIYSFFMAAWVYPVVVHSIWSGAGWASMFRCSPSILCHPCLQRAARCLPCTGMM